MKKNNNNNEKYMYTMTDINIDKEKLNEVIKEQLNKPLHNFMYEKNVDHPSWYNQINGIECIDVAQNFDFCIGNAIKYLWRAGRKHEEGLEDSYKHIEDLKKAVWYINKEIEMLEKER